MKTCESLVLIERYRQGDQAAARSLFDCFSERLLRVVDRRLSPAIKRQVDAEDLVQSAFRSFVRRDQQEPFTIENSGHLWGLLAGIAINKVRTQVRGRLAQKRDVRREIEHEDGTPIHALAGEPAPDVAVALDEQYHAVIAELRPLDRRILELHLQGHNVATISREVSRAQGRVRHILSDIARSLQNRLDDVR